MKFSCREEMKEKESVYIYIYIYAYIHISEYICVYV